MIAAFDLAAKDYDAGFTFSETGRLQRSHIRQYLSQNILQSGRLNILELNCGTGEDALWLHRAGHSIVATDISGEMIRIARSKINPTEDHGIEFRQLSFADLGPVKFPEKFDLIFSNFGGLNCIDEEQLRTLFHDITSVLNPGGRFIGVIMPRYCLWDIVYFSFKFKGKRIFQRAKQGPAEVNVAGEMVRTWYHSPRAIIKSAKDYHLRKIMPVGLFIPPSYLENYFKHKILLLKTLDLPEAVSARLPFLAGLSDHFLFDLELKS
jgi:SAM-dependent methyltransferase